MNFLIPSTITIVLYGLAAGWWIVQTLRLHAPAAAIKGRFMILCATGLVFHAAVLYQDMLTAAGLNFGFSTALSLMCWLVVLLVVLVASIRPVESLAVPLLPLAVLALILQAALPGQRIIPDDMSLGLRLHILLSLVAYGLLTVAALQAVVLAVQEYRLRTRRPMSVLPFLPPLQMMEEMLLHFLGAGFFMLSLSLVTGLVFVENLLAQHLAHKTVLSLLAWGIFGAVLVAHRTLGWRGQRLIRWTLGGFLALVLAYFGTKLVLELILHRV